MADPILGQIQTFGFNFAPRGWAFCNGQLLAISQNTALFSLLGTIYGGDGRTTFALPDLRGRASFQFGTGPGLSTYKIGEKGGQERVTLQTTDIPAHHHAVTPGAATIEGENSSPSGNFPASLTNAYSTASNASMGNTNSQNTGGGQPHNNMEPFLVINWCIALVGMYPSRN